MKKDIEWLKKEIGTEMIELEPIRKERWSDVKYQTLRNVAQKINQLDEPEVLSQEWIDKHKYRYDNIEVVGIKDLQNLVVPDRELSVIPKFVADWIEDIKPNNSLRVAFEYISQRKADDYDDPLAFWVEEGNSETFARAWLDGYEVEEEPLYYALIKGHELLDDVAKYWVHNKYDLEDLFISYETRDDSLVVVKNTMKHWHDLGINDSNADFVKVGELKK